MYSSNLKVVLLFPFVCVCEAGRRQILFCLLENRLKLPLQLILYSANILDRMQSNWALGTKWQLLVTKVSVSFLTLWSISVFSILHRLNNSPLMGISNIYAVFSLSPAKVKLLNLITLYPYFIYNQYSIFSYALSAMLWSLS